MCYDEGNRPIGVNEAEAAWLEQMSKYRTAMNNDIYTNGGLLDNTTKFGYIQPQMYGSNQIAKQILETEFTYEELSFMSRCRLASMTIPEIHRLIGLIKRFEHFLELKGLTAGQGTNGTPNYFIPQYNTNVQPLYGAPTPISIPPEWKGETPSDISRRQMGTKEWDDHFTSLSNDDVQKGPNEPDEQGEEMPSFLGSVWDNKPSHVRSSLREEPVIPGAPEPGFKNRTPKSTRVVLSAKEISPKDDIQKGPNEPDESKDKFSLKGILDYPSTGIKINDNPVPLTNEKDSADKDNEKD
jgi:hypothetical protein